MNTSNLLRAGDIVEVSGLQGAKQYNGRRGIVLGGSKPDQNGNLRHPVRLFDKGKVLEVKVDNLQRSRDLDEWKSTKLEGTLLELIRSKQSLFSEDNCGEFATKLWAEMAEQGPAHPLFIDDRLMLRNEILTASGHKLFWLALDAIGHHLLIEKCNGSYRVYQSYVTQHGFGYTAGQWCFGDMRGKSAWTKYGGGRLLGNNDINDLLDLVVRWQKQLLAALKGVLLDAVPGLNPEVIPYLQKRGPEPGTPMELLSDALDHITSWSSDLIGRIGPEGCTDIGLDPITRHVLSGREDIDVLIGPPLGGEHIFSIPAALWNKCDSLNREMTGEPFNPATFLLMLNVGIWWEARREESTETLLVLPSEEWTWRCLCQRRREYGVQSR